MCGRFVRHSPPSTYAELFGVDPIPDGPSFNVAPTHSVAAIRMADGHREGVLLRWGLIPSWEKDKKMSFVNARADTVVQKPAFRSAIKKRRCLVLADGYYEWKTMWKVKQPYYFHLRDGVRLHSPEFGNAGKARANRSKLCDPHHGAERTGGHRP